LLIAVNDLHHCTGPPQINSCLDAGRRRNERPVQAHFKSIAGWTQAAGEMKGLAAYIMSSYKHQMDEYTNECWLATSELKTVLNTRFVLQ
jgi:hypothetical protein